MKRKLKLGILIISVLLIGIILKSVTSIATATDNTYYTVNNQIPLRTTQVMEQYSYYSTRTTAYLFDNGDNTLDKVDIKNDKIYIMKLNSSFGKISEKEINTELSEVGGIYSGKNYNFVVYGQDNASKDNNAEVIRVVKYSKNWDRLGQCSINNINTTIPFDAGNCRMAEKDDKLIIHTSHEMYSGHQANLTLSINQSNMQRTFINSGTSSSGASGYVSHSFNQFVTVDGENYYTVDHGDAYPRGVVICKFNVADLSKTSVPKPTSYANVFVAEGAAGDNATGLSIGGFELSDNNCLVVGNSVRQIADGKNNYEKRNVFLTVTPKNDISRAKTKTIWLTNNDNAGKVNTTIPYIVKLNNNRFLIMWSLDGRKNYGKVQMIVVDGNGNKLTDTITFGGMLSYCKPIVFNNKVVWYSATSEIEKTIFFHIDASTNAKVNNYNNKNLKNYQGTEHFDLTENIQGDFILGTYDDSSENLVLPYIDYPWVKMSLRSATFKNCTKVKNITIPGQYGRSIAFRGEKGIFEKCKSIENVNFLNGVKKVWDDDFCNCTNLKTVNFGNTMEEIGKNAFRYTGITNLNLPNSLTTLNDYAFSSIDNLSEIKFSNGLKTIGRFAFAYAGNLKTIQLPESLEEIGENAFYMGGKLEGTIVIPSNVKAIGDETFEGNRGIEKLVFSNSNTPANSRMVINNHTMDVGETYKPLEGVKISKVEVDAGKESYVDIAKDGTITALKEGSSISVDYYVEGQEKFVFVTILKIQKSMKLKDISINKTDIKLKHGQTDKLTVTYNPTNTTDSKDLIWTSSNPNVATISNDGTITGKGNGTTVITVKCGSITKQCNVEVREAYFVNKWLNIETSTLPPVILEGMKYKAELDNGQFAEVELKVNNRNVIVSATGIIANMPGFATLTAYDERYGNLTYIAFVNDTVMLSDGTYQFPGDLNGNGAFDSEDITLLTNIINNNNLSQDNKKICDINGDGQYNNLDIEVLKTIVNENKISIGKEIPINDMDVTMDNITVDNKKRYTLKAKVWPTNTTMDKNVTYTSATPDVATVDSNGIITVLKAGNAIFIAKSVNGVYRDCMVTYTNDDITNKETTEPTPIDPSAPEVPITSISVSPTNTTLQKNQTVKITATINPTNTTQSKVINWITSDCSVATVDESGVVTGIGNGTAIITARTSNGKTAMCNVTVNAPTDPTDPTTPDTPVTPTTIPITNVMINPSNKIIKKNETFKISATVNPTNTTENKTITWITSDSTVATVDQSGLVTGKQNGTAIITAKASNGKTAICSITVNTPTDPSTPDTPVTPTVIPITSVTVNPTATTIKKGATARITATINPTNTTQSKTITWTTSNGAVATVNASGVVTGTGNGTATITARASNGKTAVCRVTVYTQTTPTVIPITSVSVNPTATTIKKGATARITATINPTNTTQSKTITWTTSNGAVATVNASGVVTGTGNGTATITARASNGKTATCRVTVYTPTSTTPTNPTNSSTPKAIPNISYRTHVQNVGWQGYVKNGQMAGTSGRALRLEGINIKLENNQYGGGVSYQTHVQNVGWQNYVQNGAMSGTSGKCLRLEGIRINLTGQIANYYDIYYRVHCQDVGWLDWAKNGESAGSSGFSYRLEGIEIKLVKKGGTAPGKTNRHFVQKYLTYQTHVQNVGWQRNVQDTEMSGTSGRSLRLEGIKIALQNKPYDGNIEYRTHVQNIGWQNYVKNGAMSGTNGRSLRLEAIQIRLTGTMAQKYDIYYRVHCQNFGWMGWAKNGQAAGSAGYCYRLEGIQICLMPKGANAPGSTVNCFRSK